jgi:hypothetical protein
VTNIARSSLSALFPLIALSLLLVATGTASAGSTTPTSRHRPLRLRRLQQPGRTAHAAVILGRRLLVRWHTQEYQPRMADPLGTIARDTRRYRDTVVQPKLARPLHTLVRDARWLLLAPGKLLLLGYLLHHGGLPGAALLAPGGGG